MNGLEKSLCSAVVGAFNSYEKMNETWLLHAPEHYLQNAILVHIGKSDFKVYLEATRQRIIETEGRKRRGRPPKDKGRRYDLIIWHKSMPKMRAVVEVKRSMSWGNQLLRDATRIKQEKHAKAGYLIVYTEMKEKRGRHKMLERFETWEYHLGLNWLNRMQPMLGTDDEWMAAFALFRTAR